MPIDQKEKEQEGSIVFCPGRAGGLSLLATSLGRHTGPALPDGAEGEGCKPAPGTSFSIPFFA